MGSTASPVKLGTGADRIEALGAVAERRDAPLERLVASVHELRLGQLDAAADQVLHLDRLIGRGLPEKRAAVDLPWNLGADRVGDRRHDVDDGRGPVVDPAVSLVRQLHEQRHREDVRGVGRRRVSPLVAGAERNAVVGGDDDQRAFVELARAKLVEELAEQTIRVAGAGRESAARAARSATRRRPSHLSPPSSRRPSDSCPSSARPMAGTATPCGAGARGGSGGRARRRARSPR